MKQLELMCAMDLDGAIGISTSNTMPWHLPSDLKRFKEVTTGKTILMGSKTFASLGRKLPQRRHVVISRGGPNSAIDWLNLGYSPEAVYPSFDIALNKELGLADKIVAIGGQAIFTEALINLASTLHITLIAAKTGGDVLFPIEGREFLKDNVGSYKVQDRTDWLEENGLKFQYITLTMG